MGVHGKLVNFTGMLQPLAVLGFGIEYQGHNCWSRQGDALFRFLESALLAQAQATTCTCLGEVLLFLPIVVTSKYSCTLSVFSSAECLLQHCPQVWPEQVLYKWLVHVLFSLSTPTLCCPFQDSRMCPAAETGIGRLQTAMVLIWVDLYCAVLGSWVCPLPLPEAETGTDRLWTAVVLYLSTPVQCCMFQAAEYVLLHFLQLKHEKGRLCQNSCGVISQYTCAMLFPAKPAVETGAARPWTAVVFICIVLCPPVLPAAETGTDRLWTAVMLYLSTPLPSCVFQLAECVLLHFRQQEQAGYIQLLCYVSVHLYCTVCFRRQNVSSSTACNWNRNRQAMNSWHRHWRLIASKSCWPVAWRSILPTSQVILCTCFNLQALTGAIDIYI